MIERDKILDDLKQAEEKVTALAETIKTIRRELADLPVTLATWDERISFVRHKMNSTIGRMEADKLRSLATVQNAQERLQALVGGV